MLRQPCEDETESKTESLPVVEAWVPPDFSGEWKGIAHDNLSALLEAQVCITKRASIIQLN